MKKILNLILKRILIQQRKIPLYNNGYDVPFLYLNTDLDFVLWIGLDQSSVPELPNLPLAHDHVYHFGVDCHCIAPYFFLFFRDHISSRKIGHHHGISSLQYHLIYFCPHLHQIFYKITNFDIY